MSVAREVTMNRIPFPAIMAVVVGLASRTAEPVRPGTEPRDALTSRVPAAWSGHPDASPVDDRIVFQRGGNGIVSDLFTITPTGRADGTEQRSIYVMATSGSRTRLLTTGSGDAGHPTWSRDGAWIIYDSNRRDLPQLFMIRADGRTARQLTSAVGP